MKGWNIILQNQPLILLDKILCSLSLRLSHSHLENVSISFVQTLKNAMYYKFKCIFYNAQLPISQIYIDLFQLTLTQTFTVFSKTAILATRVLAVLNETFGKEFS